jgi:hypothetical protein
MEVVVVEKSVQVECIGRALRDMAGKKKLVLVVTLIVVIQLLELMLLMLFVVTVGLGTIMAVDTDDILGSIILLAREKDLEDLLGTLSVSALGINGGSGDVGSHGVSTTVIVSHGSPGVVLGGRLGEPDVSSVSSDFAGL